MQQKEQINRFNPHICAPLPRQDLDLLGIYCGLFCSMISGDNL